jgi:ribosomal protein L12E/L44/L45/RPP1/RPP2
VDEHSDETLKEVFDALFKAIERVNGASEHLDRLAKEPMGITGMFDEAKHPRDERGRFGAGGAGVKEYDPVQRAVEVQGIGSDAHRASNFANEVDISTAHREAAGAHSNASIAHAAAAREAEANGHPAVADAHRMESEHHARMEEDHTDRANTLDVAESRYYNERNR